MEDKIPYHRPYPLLEEDIKEVLRDIKGAIKSGQLTNGVKVRELENKIAEMYNTEHCIATNNCTMGLMLCIKYLGYNYIQTTAFNWWSDLYIIDFLKRGALWNDIDKETWLPIEFYNQPSLYLHTFGNIGLSKRENVIYDASHCLGARLKSVGLASVFSLAPTKLVTSCEGGLIITNDYDLYKYVQEKRDRMSRMSEVHAIIGLKTLEHIEEVKEWKKEVYFYYRQNIPGQFQKMKYDSSYNTIGFLNTEGLKIPDHIEIRQYYEPIYKTDTLPNTKEVYENIICLPSYFNCDYIKIVDDILEVNGL